MAQGKEQKTRKEYNPERLKNVLTNIVSEYMGTQSFATVFHARLESISPLKFVRDDGIEMYENFLVVPKYRKFTEEEIGHLFVFSGNHEMQVFYYLYESSYPQGSNGRSYHWEGYLEKATLHGTCSCGHDVVVTHGEIIDCRHDWGIRKVKD